MAWCFAWEALPALLLFANWAGGKFRAMIRHAKIHLPSNNYESQQGAEGHALPKIATDPKMGENYQELEKGTSFQMKITDYQLFKNEIMS